MSEISQIQVNGTTYDLCDATSRDIFDALEVTPRVSHRNIFRGKYLGNTITTDQWTAISNGTFDDLYVGDYWTLTTTVDGTTYTRDWRIADIDYYYNYGDTAFTTHHLCVVPDKVLYSAKMNDSNITTSNYRGSKMYTTYINTAITIATNVFGSSHVKTHREYFNDGVTNGYNQPWTSGVTQWGTTKVCELMSEDQVYGHPHFRAGTFYYTGTNTTVPGNNSNSQRQLAAFALDPTMLNKGRENYWLRDVVNSTNFALVTGDGDAGDDSASRSRGVRPLVIIG